MSGRHEKETMFDNRIKRKLVGAPPVITEYYYSLIGSGKSYATTYNYINYLMAFIAFTFEDNCPKDFYTHVKPMHINKYIASLRTKTTKGETKRTSDSFKTTQWSALHTFFSFLIPEYLKDNPVMQTTRPKMKDNPDVTYLTPEEITKMLDNVVHKSADKTKHRDLSLLKLGFSTGLRASAIVQLDIDDIDFTNSRIKVTEKGDYDNYIILNEKMKQQLLLWLDDRQKYFGHFKTNALFVSQMGNRLSALRLSELIRKYAEGATDKHVTPHVMRHSCATNLYEKTGDIYLCAKQLNHKNVITTQRYAEISKSKQKEAASILEDLI